MDIFLKIIDIVSLALIAICLVALCILVIMLVYYIVRPAIDGLINRIEDSKYISKRSK